MKECDFFESGNSRPRLKVYAILKQERAPKSLLSSPKNRAASAPFSWPPRKNCGRLYCNLVRRQEDKKK